MIKLLSGFPKGAYGLQPGTADPHEIKPWFPNPQHPDSNIYFVICPTHQMKNMINQLFASQGSGAKKFQIGKNGKVFGWEQIKQMWEREKERRDTFQVRLVHDLLLSHIERDAWTKLNVKPAKIMQQSPVLAELYSYANPDTGNQPQDAPKVMSTHRFLSACQKIFEFGFLNSSPDSKIMDVDTSDVLANIEAGFMFFKEWMDQLIRECGDFRPTAPLEIRFISWQTYDLLRICYYSFKAFCKEYLDRNPGYYVVAMKLNGSAVETLFSQYKFSVGGKLTSVNVQYAKRSVMLKKNVGSGQNAAKGYRDVPLYHNYHNLPKRKKTS